MNQSQFRKAGFISLDTATLILKGVSVNFMIERLKLDKYKPSEFAKSELWSSPVAEAFCYDLNGVQFRVPKADCSCFRIDPDSEDVFKYQFQKISINFTGTGMKFMRHHFEQIGEETWFDDWLLHCPAKWLQTFKLDSHFSRLDFAVDFVNDFSNIVNNVVRHLDYGGGMGTPGKFVAATGSRSYQCQVNSSERGSTVYIGSPSSDQRLRIYDKYGESTDEHGVWLPGKAPEFDSIDANDIHNWVRFELVLRNKKALEFTPDEVDSPSVLQFPEMFVKIICEKFQPAKGSHMPEWWGEFWKPIQDDPSIIKRDLHFVQLATPIEKAVKHIGMNSMHALLVVMVRYGVKVMLQALQRYFVWMQRANTMDSGKSWLSFKRKFRNSGLDFENYHVIWSSKFDCYVLDFPEYGVLDPLTDEYVRENPEIIPLVR